MQKSQRLTIKPHNIAYLQTLAYQMGLENLSEVVNYLLLDVKGLNYTFGSKPAPQPQTTPIGYGFDTATFEPVAPIQECDTVGALRDGALAPAGSDRNHLEVDPIIARMASLIEEF
ncbi:MAG: hypothetical protein KME22_08295 [Hassallia sp. WJT32-NPBG1]|jgi:hypothetical protein|nr:hypothetical protein [Hassallia sp. WJT32-NPBG1]